jgi:hypothetical protein
LPGRVSTPLCAEDGSGDRQKGDAGGEKPEQEVREIEGERLGATQSENVGQAHDHTDQQKNPRGDTDPSLAQAIVGAHSKKEVGKDCEDV